MNFIGFHVENSDREFFMTEGVYFFIKIRYNIA